MKCSKFDIEFVHRVPSQPKDGILYVCLECNVVVHLCACGCGEKVVLPIAPDFWKFYYDGEGVSLFPSVGNFNFACNSHYYIRNSNVLWVAEDEDSDLKRNEHTFRGAKQQRAPFWKKGKKKYPK